MYTFEGEEEKKKNKYRVREGVAALFRRV